MSKYSKYTVFGYIRNIESKRTFTCDIPMMIIYICLTYYFHGEYWYKYGHDLVISKDKTSITKAFNANNKDNRAFGKNWIDMKHPQIVKWRFKFNQIGEFSKTHVGLWETCTCGQGNTLEDESKFFCP